MTYSEFNKSSFEYYLKRTSSSFFTLSIDSTEFKNIANIDLVKTMPCLQRDWQDLLKIDNGVPQYFGLLAVQCLAASMMEKDNLSSDKAYKIRLGQLLNIKDGMILQTLFKGFNPVNPIQEQIWYNAKSYLKSEYNLILDIPLKRSDAGRFVQYPKSQALFNSEDLKYFTLFFGQEFEVKEDIPLEYFKKRLEACFYNLNTTNRTPKLWEDSDKREQCIRQLFNYYNLWEGEVHFAERTNESTVLSLQLKHKDGDKKPKAFLILSFDENEPKFYAVGLNKEETFGIGLNELEKYKLVNNEFLIFNKSDYYKNEFENSRFLHSNAGSYVLINKQNTVPSTYRYLERNNSQIFLLSDTLTLYQVNLLEELDSPLTKYMQKAKPITLIGGLKINRGNKYLQGYGPSIMSDGQKTVLFENRKIEYNPQIERPGCYIVRVPYCKDVSFDIIEAERSSQVVLQHEWGWNLVIFSIDSEFELQGLILKAEHENENIIRSWISINTKKLKSKNTSTNTLINALNNSFDNDWKS